MDVTELLLSKLSELGDHGIVAKMRLDFANPNAFWHRYSEERQILCSFLNVYLDHNDADARLTLCPTNERFALVQEIIEDVIPLIRCKPGF